MKSLYDTLHLDNPEAPSAPPADLVLKLTGKAFSKAVLESIEFRTYIVRGLQNYSLPPAVVCRLMDHAWGKPVDRIEVKRTNELEHLTVAQLEQRALFLANVAKNLRASESPSDLGDHQEGTVH